MSLRSKLIRLAHNNPDLRPDLLPLLKRTAGKVSIQLHRGLSVKDSDGMSPLGEISQVAYLDERKSGSKASRAAVQVARENQRELESMSSGDQAVGFIESKVYEMTGKHLRWQYIQTPM